MSTSTTQLRDLDRVLGSASNITSPSLFLQAPPLSLQIKQGIKINSDLAKFQSNQTVDALLGINRTKEEREPKQISYQILAEAGRAMAPEAFLANSLNADSSSSEIASSDNNKQAVEEAAKLSDNPQGILNPKVKEGIEAFGRRKATLAEQKIKHNETAAGGITTISSVRNDVSGVHQVFSEVGHYLQAPSVEVLAQNRDTIVNGVDNRVAGMQLANYQQSVKQISGSELKTAGSSLKVVFSSDEKVAKTVKSVGTESHSTMAKKNSVAGDSEVEVFSAGSLSNVSYQDTASIFGGNLSIVGSNKIVPEGHPTKELTQAASPSIQLAVFDKDNKYSGLSISDGMSGVAPQIALQSDSATLSLNRTYAALIGRGLVLSDGRNSILSFAGAQLHVNLPIGRAFMPTSPPSVKDPIQSVTLPKLPDKELENCIPASIRQQQREQRRLDDLEFNKPGDKSSLKSKLFRQGIRPEEFKPSSAPPNQQINRAAVKEQERKGKFADLSLKADINSNTKSTVGSVNKAIAPIPAVGITGIYSRSSFTEGNALPLLLSGIDDNTQLPDKELLARDIRSRITAEGIQSAFQSLVSSNKLPTQVVNSLTPELLGLALEVGLDEITPEIKVESFPLDVPRERAQQFVSFIRAYPQTIPSIKTYLLELAKPLAIGFISGLAGGISLAGSLLGSVGIKLPGMNLINQIPSILSAKSPLEFAQVGLQALSSLGIKIPGADIASTLIGSFVNNKGNSVIPGGLVDKLGSALGISDSSLLGVASSILQDPSVLRGGDIFSGSLGGTLRTAITSQLGSLIGSDLGPAVSQLTNLIANPGSATTEEYVSQISGILSSTTGISELGRASQVYSSIQGLIQASKNQNVLEILGGRDLESTVNAVLGEANSGEISRVFGIIRNSTGLFESLSLLPQLLEKMDDYSIPALDQISIAFSCLDLLNKIRSLIDSFKRDSRSLDENKNVVDKPAVFPRSFELAISNVIVSNTTRSAVFEVVLGAPLSSPLTISFQTINNTAIAGVDFAANSGTITFQPGDTVRRIGVRLIPNKDKPSKNFSVKISNPISITPVQIIREEGICFIEGAGSVPTPTTELQVRELIEVLPRTVQLVNSINTITSLNPNSISAELAYLDVEIPNYLDPCFKLSPLTISESDVTVLGIYQGFLFFTMTNLSYLSPDISNIPGEGSVVQLVVQEYTNSNTGELLLPYRDNSTFTPRFLNFSVMQYDLQKNIGIAVYEESTVPLVLINRDTLLYEYSPLVIGTQLIPAVSDSYLLY